VVLLDTFKGFVTAIAKYAFKGQQEGDLVFAPGDVITNIRVVCFFLCLLICFLGYFVQTTEEKREKNDTFYYFFFLLIRLIRTGGWEPVTE
jgi:hypothetical protein